MERLIRLLLEKLRFVTGVGSLMVFWNSLANSLVTHGSMTPCAQQWHSSRGGISGIDYRLEGAPGYQFAIVYQSLKKSSVLIRRAVNKLHKLGVIQEIVLTQ